jgi:hypothetical protein
MITEYIFVFLITRPIQKTPVETRDVGYYIYYMIIINSRVIRSLKPKVPKFGFIRNTLIRIIIKGLILSFLDPT